jgi:hypothetical protein
VSASRSELALLALASLAGATIAGCGETAGPVLGRVPPIDPPATDAELVAYGNAAPRSLADLDAIAAVIAETPQEELPFDGLVVNFQLENAFRSIPSNTDIASAMVARWLAPPFDRMPASFALLKVTPGDVDWEDDAGWAVVAANVRALASTAREAGMRGVFLDTQTYGVDVFSLPAVGAGRTFEVLELAVRERGRAVGTEIQRELPGGVVMLTLAYSELWRSACLDGVELAVDRYGLLPAFLDGLVEVLGQDAVIDGFLPSYPVTDPRAFPLFRRVIHAEEELDASWLPGVMTYRNPRTTELSQNIWPETPTEVCTESTRARVHRPLTAAFGLMLDWPYPSAVITDPARFDENHVTPAELGELLTGAMASSDGYVWMWGTGVDWWSRPGGTLGPLPDEYRDAMAEARR